jgi:hypothetical protein
MFNDKLAEAIGDARTLARLDQLSEALWKSWGAGGISDDDANAAAALLSARRTVVRGDIVPVGIPPGRPSIFPPRRLQRPPDRPAAAARRRQLAASGPMPPALAARFTTAELAVLRIVGDEVREKGCCARSIAEIAARAGCGRTSVQNAIRQAARLGLLTVQERRRQGDVNLPNVVRIVSREWVTWLKRGRAVELSQSGKRKGAEVYARTGENPGRRLIAQNWEIKARHSGAGGASVQGSRR